MKKFSVFLTNLTFILVSLTASSQKYKTAADTVKLNKEYVEVSNDIADLTAKLTIAQNNLPGYNNKAGEATSDAQSAAIKTSEQASKAVNGDVSDARSAKRKAKRALREAKDASEAKEKVADQENKIAKLTSQLQKKQERLQELETMRTAIMNLPQ